MDSGRRNFTITNANYGITPTEAYSKKLLRNQYYTRMCLPEIQCISEVEVDTIQPLELDTVLTENMLEICDLMFQKKIMLKK